MIKLKDLSVKNFMSVGNVSQAVNFNTEQLTLVLGENLDQGGDDSGSRNGTGKTTIVNALSYALYGQALTNIKKNNLINKTNSKGMLVTLRFEKNGIDYRIERGRSPNIMKFYINNQEQELVDESQGDSRETQKTIDSLLGMSHDMFKHIVALNTYTEPFLSMKTNDQRVIIEQLLGITLLSEKAEALKEQIKLTKDTITEETLKINAIQSSNEKIKLSIETLETRQRAWQAKRRQDCETIARAIYELEELDIEEELESHEKLQNWLDLTNQYNALNKERSALEPSLSRADKSIVKIEKEIKELDDAICYACGQSLHEHKKQEILKAKQKDLHDTSTYRLEIENKLQKVEKEIKDIGNIENRPNTYYETIKEAYDHRNNVENFRKALENREIEEDPYQQQIDDLVKTAIQPIDWNIINSLSEFKDHQEFLLRLLTNKDSFIRKKIIDQNLTYLNNRLTWYLETLGLPHKVIFLNDLNVEISLLGQDLDFDNLSRGERNRLILGLSFSFRDVWESLYQNINLLFIDELIDSGMDTAGVENSLAVLKKIARERNKNIFLISHKDELIGRVNSILKVIKENGFTTYANDLDLVE
jgi:DNA repair exonuclease SbcCD ATPase subunit